MNNTWPQWATLRAEQVTQLPADQRGPWAYGNSPCRVAKDGQHQPEPPYFFHCQKHLEEIRQKTKQTKLWPSRDQGLCTSCGKPAEHLPKTMNHRVACVRAESTNSTVARLNTRKYCQKCSTKNGSLCRGATCRSRDQKQRNIVQGPNCCPTTRTGTRRHCSVCCLDARQRKLERENQTPDEEADTDSGASLQQTPNQRKKQVTQLRKAGMNSRQIADKLNVSQSTIDDDIAALRAMTRPAIEAKTRRLLQRHETILYLSSQGLAPREIAQKLEIAETTVQKYLQSPATPAQPKAHKPDHAGADKPGSRQQDDEDANDEYVMRRS